MQTGQNCLNFVIIVDSIANEFVVVCAFFSLPQFDDFVINLVQIFLLFDTLTLFTLLHVTGMINIACATVLTVQFLEFGRF